MMEIKEQSTWIVERISPVYEKVVSARGDGFAGFTIYYPGDTFANHVQFFDQSTHSQVSKQVKAIHAGYLEACTNWEKCQ